MDEPLGRRRILVLSILVTVALAGFLSWPRQEGDPRFDASVPHPALAAKRPRLLVDEGHVNVHTSTGRYKPFADLGRNDGCVVSTSTGLLTYDALRGQDILVTANPLGRKGGLQAIANAFGLEKRLSLAADAFTDDECDAVVDFVERGGSLLLVADHAPSGRAARRLSMRFGVDMTDRYVEDPRNHDEVTGNWGFLVFSADNGLLVDHPLVRGRDETERVRRVVSFTGQALVPPAGSVPFLRLSSSAIEFPFRDSADDDHRSAAGLAQGVALRHGKGRVVVMGEAALLTSQEAGRGGRTLRFGMSFPDCDDRQLTLNVVRWLAGLL